MASVRRPCLSGPGAALRLPWLDSITVAHGASAHYSCAFDLLAGGDLRYHWNRSTGGRHTTRAAARDLVTAARDVDNRFTMVHRHRRRRNRPALSDNRPGDRAIYAGT